MPGKSDENPPSGELRVRLAAVAEADVPCEEMLLLTLASSPEVRALRAWMTEQVFDQLAHGAKPTSWRDWSSRRAGRRRD